MKTSSCSCPPLTFHHRYEPPDTEAPHRGELSQRRLQEEQRDPGKHQGQKVRDQKGPLIDQEVENMLGKLRSVINLYVA